MSDFSNTRSRITTTPVDYFDTMMAGFILGRVCMYR